MLLQQLIAQLFILRDLLEIITDEQYTKRIKYLNDSSIGAHSRHIIELIQCLTNGYATGKVDYINRERDFQIEQNRLFAISKLQMMATTILQNDQQMELLSESHLNEEAIKVNTTYFREIEYNKEHTIHHLALIRVALREMELDIVSESFGVAHATIKYLSQQQIQQA